MPYILRAITDSNAEPIEDTCLCTMCYTKENIEWQEMNHPNAVWLEYDPDKEEERTLARQAEILRQTNKRKTIEKLTCVICGYPINEIYDNISL